MCDTTIPFTPSQQSLLDAIRDGNVELLKSLLQSGVNPDFFDDCDNPLALALPHPECLRVLLESGADPKQTPFFTGGNGEIYTKSLLADFGYNIVDALSENEELGSWLESLRILKKHLDLTTKYPTYYDGEMTLMEILYSAYYRHKHTPNEDEDFEDLLDEVRRVILTE